MIVNNLDKNAKRKPVLLVSARVTEESSYVEKRTALAYDYVSFLEKLGYLIIMIPANSKQVEEYLLMDYQAVVLTGGNTCHPCDGGETPKGFYAERDRTESLLIQGAVTAEKPLLGICRGMQFINSFFGGQISYGIGGHVNRKHSIFSSDPALDRASVNSFHDDGVVRADLAPKLKELASSEDGYIEAYIHNELSILGIQWHPERQSEEFDRNLIQKFIKTGKIQ